AEIFVAVDMVVERTGEAERIADIGFHRRPVGVGPGLIVTGDFRLHAFGSHGFSSGSIGFRQDDMLGDGKAEHGQVETCEPAVPHPGSAKHKRTGQRLPAGVILIAAPPEPASGSAIVSLAVTARCSVSTASGRSPSRHKVARNRPSPRKASGIASSRPSSLVIAPTYQSRPLRRAMAICSPIRPERKRVSSQAAGTSRMKSRPGWPR